MRNYYGKHKYLNKCLICNPTLYNTNTETYQCQKIAQDGSAVVQGYWMAEKKQVMVEALTEAPSDLENKTDKF